VISTLKLRYDALTTGELSLYRDLMEQRDITVPAWFTRIQSMVERELPVSAIMVPETWDGSTRAGSAEIARQTLKSIQADHDRKYGKSETPEFKTAVCGSCQTETIMPFNERHCHWCSELHAVRDRTGPAIALYELAVEKTKICLPLPSLSPSDWVGAWLFVVSALWIAFLVVLFVDYL
jgi:hypothetical protein